MLAEHESTHDALLDTLGMSLVAADSMLAALPQLIVLRYLVRDHASSLDARALGVKVWCLTHMLTSAASRRTRPSHYAANRCAGANLVSFMRRASLLGCPQATVHTCCAAWPELKSIVQTLLEGVMNAPEGVSTAALSVLWPFCAARKPLRKAAVACLRRAQASQCPRTRVTATQVRITGAGRQDARHCLRRSLLSTLCPAIGNAGVLRQALSDVQGFLCIILQSVLESSDVEELVMEDSFSNLSQSAFTCASRPAHAALALHTEASHMANSIVATALMQARPDWSRLHLQLEGTFRRKSP